MVLFRFVGGLMGLVLMCVLLGACASAEAPDAEEGDVLDSDAWFSDVSGGGGAPEDADPGGQDAPIQGQDTAAPMDTGSGEDTPGEDVPVDVPPPMDTSVDEDTASPEDTGEADSGEPDTAAPDTSEPPLCGNGRRDPGEDCDPALDGSICPDGCEFNHAILCQPCDSDVSCGRSIDRCVTLDDGGFCASACVDDSWCPTGYTCQEVDADVRGCLPERNVCGDCFDPDGDGYGVGSGCRGEDCVENDRDSFPGGMEVCDGVDNDCDNRVDEGVTPPTVWPDIDGDGFGSSSAASVSRCPVPERHEVGLWGGGPAPIGGLLQPARDIAGASATA